MGQASSHQGEFPRATQDHSIACDTEKLKLATQFLFLANADHAALVPLIARFVFSVAGSDIEQLVDVLVFASVHTGYGTGLKG